jgi:Phytanoyl-CoA dioxygenase (PhyH)
MEGLVHTTDIASLDADGYCIVPGNFSASQLSSLQESINVDTPNHESRTKGAVYGIRNLLATSTSIQELSRSGELMGLARRVIGEQAFPVRVQYFDKLHGGNWHLPWHQDLAIAVRQKMDVEGYSAWSVKAGVPHVIPPANILVNMIAIRLHLDDCPGTNGPLEVIPGSHLQGKIGHAEIQDRAAKGPQAACVCNKGDLVLMKPLTIHGSKPAQIPSHRRVIHIEYASTPLDGGLEWYSKN